MRHDSTDKHKLLKTYFNDLSGMDTAAHAAYLSIRGRTARIFRNADVREAVLAAASPSSIIDLIARREPA